MRRRTLSKPFTLSGVGVHTGARAAVTVAPAAWGAGIAFRDRDRPRRKVPAQIEYVSGSGGATSLALGPARVQTVEHLLAALYGAGITDADVAVHGPELPVLDGSAKPWADAIAGAGMQEGPDALVIVVTQAVKVSRGASWATLEPADRCEVRAEVDFGDPRLPRGDASVVIEGDRFRDEVAWARTFVLERDADRLRAAGRGKGASRENTVVWGRSELRAPDEAVRHKLLDAVGDLALLGAPVRAKMTVHRGSHALHHALLRALVNSSSWTEEGEDVQPRDGPEPELPSGAPGIRAKP